MSSLPAAPRSAQDATVEQILRLRFPHMLLMDGVAALAKAIAKDEVVPSDPLPHIQVERERLQQLSQAELSQILQALQAKARTEAVAREREKAAAAEAAKFYNLPTAAADFDFWTKVDYWTLDESLVLLLGREPKIVTANAIKRELESRSLFLFEAKQPLTAFLADYQRLRELAQRADVMTRTPKLRPADVIQWADRVGMANVPAALRQVLASTKPPSSQLASMPGAVAAANQREAAVGAPPPATTLIKKAALLARYEREWPTVHSDLAHAKDNGLAEAAKAEKFGFWYEEAAVQWARQNGKMKSTTAERAPSLDDLPRWTNRLAD